MLKILLVHNYLRPPSGENVVYENEKRLLLGKGHSVICFERHNQEIASYRFFRKVSLKLRAIWAHDSFKSIIDLIRKNKPDVAHFHNVFPLISPFAYHACVRMGVPVVQTLHHFRLVCPGGFLFRNGKICEDCTGLRFQRGIKHACYRTSRIQTLGMAAVIYAHYIMRTWQNCVDNYIALSSFAKQSTDYLRAVLLVASRPVRELNRKIAVRKNRNDSTCFLADLFFSCLLGPQASPWPQ